MKEIQEKNTTHRRFFSCKNDRGLTMRIDMDPDGTVTLITSKSYGSKYKVDRWILDEEWNVLAKENG